MKSSVGLLALPYVAMNCECNQPPHIFNVERYPNLLKDRLEFVDRKDESVMRFHPKATFNKSMKLTF